MIKKKKPRVFRLVFSRAKSIKGQVAWDVLVAIQEKMGPKHYRWIDVGEMEPEYELEVVEVLPKKRAKK